MTKRSRHSVPALLLLVVFAPACGNKDAPGEARSNEQTSVEAPPSSSAPVASASGATSASAQIARGLAAPDNDPALVATLKTILTTCKDALQQKEFLKHKECDAWNQLEARELPGARPTLINLLFDEDPAVRRMATYLFRNDKSKVTPQQVERMFLALENDLGASPTNTALASVALSQSHSAELVERIFAIGSAKTTPADVRTFIAADWDVERGYGVTTALAAESDPAALLGASEGYAKHFKGHEAEACAFWAHHTAAEDESLRRSAVGHLSGEDAGYWVFDTESDWSQSGYAGGPSNDGLRVDWCPSEIDGLLSTIEKNLNGDIVFKPYLEALTSIATHLMSTSEQKKKAVALLKQVIEKGPAKSRDIALRLLVSNVPDEIAYANKFAKDPELASEVSSLRDDITDHRESAKKRDERWAERKKELEAQKNAP